LCQSWSRRRKRERKDARADYDSLFQDTIPRSRYLRSTQQLIASANAPQVKQTAYLVCVAFNDSRELGRSLGVGVASKSTCDRDEAIDLVRGGGKGGDEAHERYIARHCNAGR
jgi:hypothetical protein